MYGIVVKNVAGNFGEILTDVDLSTFKYDYEKNGERAVSFTAFKTNRNAEIFNMLTNENIIQWEGQDYVIKSSSLNYEDRLLSNEIVGKHIFMEFQNHFIDQDIQNESLNDDVSSDENDKDESKNAETLMTLEQYLTRGFKGNELGFSYEIIGNGGKRAPVSEIGNKNGLEHLTEGAELFGYIYFADNKKIYVYVSEDDFYKRSDEVLIYEYNLTNVKATVDTSEMKTYIKGYGKKKTKAETKNYSPIKPKNLKYSGKFTKEGTWFSTQNGASYEKTFTCKWGSETLTWTNKRMSKGGMVDIYLDGKKIDTISQYNKTTKTDSVVISKNLSKGNHTFKVVFRGAKSGVNYKKKTPSLLVGTEKTTILNLTAVLKGSDVYHVYGDYTSPNASNLNFGKRVAPTVFDDGILYKADLMDRLKKELNDEPKVELSTSYLGYEKIDENHTLRFVHKPMNFNVDLKVVKITKYHPYLNEPSEIEFSNEAPDITKIQQKINERIHNANSSLAYGGMNTSMVENKLYSDVVGSVLVDD